MNLTTLTMTGTEPKSFKFHCFSKLPAELRNLIWEEALPRKFGPTLYVHKDGCWIYQFLKKSDERFDPQIKQFDYAFNDQLLDGVQLKLPLLFVNHEARSIALSWVDKIDGIKMQRSRRHPTFKRTFDPETDVLYLPLDSDWYEDHMSPLYKRPLVDNNYSIWSLVKRIALPEKMIIDNPQDTLCDLLVCHPDLEEVLIVVGDQQPSLSKAISWWKYLVKATARSSSTIDRAKTNSWWEYVNAEPGVFIWNQKGAFVLRGDTDTHKKIYEVIELATNRNDLLLEDLSWKHHLILKIRAVYAIPKQMDGAR
jgi:hypothetical protein